MTLPTIHVAGTSFVNDQGDSLTYAGCDAFSAFARWYHGDNPSDAFLDYKALYTEAHERSAWEFGYSRLLPVLRIFFMVDSFAQIHPPTIPNFYQGVRAFCQWIGDEWKFYIDAEVFADAQIIMPDVTQQQQHLRDFAEAVRGLPHVLGSLGNEYKKNGFYPGNFDKPPTGLWSRGSTYGGGEPPFTPPWDYSKQHGKRDPIQKMLLAPGDLVWSVAGWQPESTQYLGVHQATIADEDIGAADEPVPGRRTNRPEYFYSLGIASALYGAGGTFHSDNGIKAIPLSAQQRLCGVHYMVGLSRVDPRLRFVG